MLVVLQMIIGGGGTKRRFTIAFVKVFARTRLKEEVTCGELERYTRHGPHVHRSGVTGAQYCLQRPVLASLNVICEMLKRPTRVSKVNYLYSKARVQT